jgi:uncharacterized protein YbbK (DUF523 family)
MGDAHIDAQRPAVLVSACLLGVACNHRGQANPAPSVRALASGHRLVAICPETAGGLPTPRAAAELQADGRVATEVGDDVTDAFRRGAAAAVALATAVGAERAVLKARSPSCGCDGVTTLALRHAGLTVESEEDLDSR